MGAIKGAQSVLLFDEKESILLPFSTDGFNVSTGRKGRVLQRYLGTIVVYRDGSVSRIEGIRFLGLWGVGLCRKVFSFINGGTRRISVTLSPLPGLQFHDVRQLAVEYCGKRPELIEQYFESAVPELALDRVKASSTYAELFDAVGVPAPLNCLDSLS